MKDELAIGTRVYVRPEYGWGVIENYNPNLKAPYLVTIEDNGGHYSMVFKRRQLRLEAVEKLNWFQRIRKWWWGLALIKCDYCNDKVKLAYDAYLFEVPEYKGNEICLKCIKKLPKQENIVYC